MVTICAVLMAVLFVGIWVVDALSLPHAVEVAANLVQAGVALVLLRVAVQTVLLHETPDPATGDAVVCALREGGPGRAVLRFLRSPPHGRRRARRAGCAGSARGPRIHLSSKAG